MIRSIFISILFILTSIFPARMVSQIRIISQKDTVYVKSVKDSVERLLRTDKEYIKILNQGSKPHLNIDFTLSRDRGLETVIGLVKMYRTSIVQNSPQSYIGLFTGASTREHLFTGVAGKHYSRNERWIYDYMVRGLTYRDYIWGVGYLEGNDNLNKSRYRSINSKIEISPMYRIKEGMLFGAVAGFDYVLFKEVEGANIAVGQPRVARSVNAGVKLELDRRDNSLSTHRGLFLTLEQRAYRYTDKNGYFYKTKFIFDLFLPLSYGTTLALDLFGDLNYGDFPWVMMPMMGSESRMRSYYRGRYRDTNLLTAQLELRQVLYKGHSMVVWTGCGNLFSSFSKFNINHTLPEAGLGYRYLFDSTNMVKIDLGYGKTGFGFQVGYKEAF